MTYQYEVECYHRHRMMESEYHLILPIIVDWHRNNICKNIFKKQVHILASSHASNF